MHAKPKCTLAQQVIIQVEHDTIIDSSAIQMLHLGSQFQYILICANVREDRDPCMPS